MNYEDMFEFKEIEGGYELTSYRKKDLGIYKVEIPGQYNGKPVLRIGSKAFEYSRALKEVYIPPEVKTIAYMAFCGCTDLCAVGFSEGLTEIEKYAFLDKNTIISLKFPKSLERIGDGAFTENPYLERAVFQNPRTSLGENVFFNCPRLSAEAQLMNIVRSADITQPVHSDTFVWFNYLCPGVEKPFFFLREEVFALAVKNKCFRGASHGEIAHMLEALVKNGFQSLLRIAADGGLLTDAGLTEKLIGISLKHGQTELTAWLLEYKNRKFGFDGGNKLEL